MSLELNKNGPKFHNTIKSQISHNVIDHLSIAEVNKFSRPFFMIKQQVLSEQSLYDR